MSFVSSIPTPELVNNIFFFCEQLSGSKLFPYQAEFGKRIIRSIITGEGTEITALFSRQCIKKGSLVYDTDRKLLPIEEVKGAWKTADSRECFRIITSGGRVLEGTEEHPIATFSDVWVNIGDLKVGDKIACLYGFSDEVPSGCCLNTRTESTGEVLVEEVVVSKESIGNYEVWDLEVPGKGWFICNGVKVHNSGKSHTVSVMLSGLSIILPILANMPAFTNDHRLVMFRGGFLLGIFAPCQDQAKIIFNNIKRFLETENAANILLDPEINVTFGTNNGENFVLKFKNLGVESKISCKSASETANIEGGSFMVIVCDEAQDIADLVYQKSIFPMGTYYNASKILIGTATTKRGFFYDIIEKNKLDYAAGDIKKSHFENDWKVVSKYNVNYMKSVEAAKRTMGEDSDAFQMSYCLKWLLHRGMFITVDKLESLEMPDMDIVLQDGSKRHVAGIDLGRSKDSTVVTVVEVDWDNPVVLEESKEPGVPDYVVYETFIKAWLEIQGDDWNQQYDSICDFLANFSLETVVVDATGVGSGMYDRLNAYLSRLGITCIPYVFSRQSKSALFKHFDSQIKSDRFHYPGGEMAKASKEYEHFKEQMAMAEKSYSGSDMIVQAPNTRKAHDDYICSSALAVWGARGEAASRPTTAKENPFTASLRNSYTYRNKLTARRR